MASKSETSYIQTSISSDLPIRADGRSLIDYRPISLVTGVAALANGSARVKLGGTEILAASKLEVEDVESAEGVDGGRILCVVSCSPSAYPHSSSTAIDDIQYDLSQILNSALGHISLRSSNLTILPHKKSWLLNLDCLVLADGGNVYDTLFIAARAALWNTRVPTTRPIEYKAPHYSQVADFELCDYWDDGEVLEGGDRWPVCITLNLLSSRHFLDATTQEETAIPLRLLLIFSCPTVGPATLQGTRLIGPGEIAPTQLISLMKDGEKYAKELVRAIDAKLRSKETREPHAVG